MQISAVEALGLVIKATQRMRESGESDMRSVIWIVQGLQRMVEQGRSREEIAAEFEDDEDGK